MKHYGNVTKINGAVVEPVDIITLLEFSDTPTGFPWRWSGMTRPPQSWCYVKGENND
jgi:hypothetical protein